MQQLLVRRRFSVLLVILAVVLGLAVQTKANTPSSNAVCKDVTGARPTFLANQAPAGSNHFGADPGTTDVTQLKRLMHEGRCLDPAMAVSHASYSARNFSALADGGVGAQLELIAHHGKWTDAVKALEAKEATATNVDVVSMSDKYQTMYEVLGGQVPVIHQATVNRPTYMVIRFTYADGSTDIYKIDCHFQPVAPNLGETPPIGHKPKPRCTHNCVPVTIPKCRSNCTTQTTRPTCTSKCTPDTTVKPGKCDNVPAGQFCGSNTSGPEQQMQPSDQTGTPGYTPGNAETVRDKQTHPSDCQARGDCASDKGTDSGSHENNDKVPHGGDNGDNSGGSSGIDKTPTSTPDSGQTDGDPCAGDPNCGGH